MSNRLFSCLAMALMVVICGVTKADIDKDKAQCTDQLVGLASCLPYVGGQAPEPPKDCCTGLKQVLTKSMVCLCILIKDHNDPSLNLKINDTLALGLPDACHTPANITQCLGLLHLQSGSPEAKVFDDYAKRIKSNSTITIVPPGGPNATTANSSTSSDGGRIKTTSSLEVIKIVGLLFVMVLLHYHVSNEIDR
ncbi:hypothetical protein QVD17_11280 [Tagetes erecta]|uniref:Bifunctional inhibitor/plant lipid transfer protein/seed storage helical domain-containing protein n=1 Tax=Tagetes erecta TaxID=13708 RepID=A0AAD8KT53_TARER|nr:hypothetical protein QVD17_11280 [Tagetes erecta]